MTTPANVNGAASSGIMARAIKEGLFAGLLALGLFSLYIGIKTDQNMQNELVWYTRPGLLAIFVIIAAFWYIVNKTPLGRAQRATEQDRKMAALLGVDVDRTISITFVMGAALAAVAGTMYLM